MSRALVVGKFAPPHHGHQILIDKAFEVADEVVILCWANPEPHIADSATRAAWLRELYPAAMVIAPEDPPANDAHDEVHRAFCRDLLDGLGLTVDMVVTGEDYGDGFAETMGAAHVRLTRDWSTLSGTIIRADPHGNRHLVDERISRHLGELVVLMGAESTGKSTLAKALAEHFGTTWVHEYGREHYELKDGRLDLDDYVEIARVHRTREEEARRGTNGWIFCDTNAITTMTFSHLYDRDSRPELREMAAGCIGRYGLTVVCDDDIEFEQDGWRDTAEWRSRMQGIILADLAVRGIPYVVASGGLEQRISTVEAALVGGLTPSFHPPSTTGGHGPRPDDEAVLRSHAD